MKNVVISETGKATEFKPDAIFEKYLKLTEKDLKKEFNRKKNQVLSNCPACKSKKKKPVFSHSGFKYMECLSCGSVYADPRPPDADIKKHYLESASAGFWRNTLSRITEGKRREKIYEKRFQWFRDVAQNYMPCATTIADFNSKDPEYLREFLQNGYFKRKIVVNPHFDISSLDIPNVDEGSYSVIESFADSLKDKGIVDVACLCEVIDRASDVERLLKTINVLLCKGGLCFVTTISISGFDLQVLWENSTSIFPPDRINVLSRAGLELLFKRHGFDMVEYSTPGFLDLDIVKNAARKDPSIKLPKFVEAILKNGDDQVQRDFQDFLQISKLSSFVRIVLRKK